MWSLLALIMVANSAPVIARDALGGRWAAAVDGGLTLRDGRPLFGASKTWRGLLAALAASCAFAPLLGLGWLTGLAAGALAMAGDLLASFTKRRLGLAPSSRAPLLDTVPEALLPGLGLKAVLGLAWTDVLLLCVLFTAIVALASPVLFRLHIRKRPW